MSTATILVGFLVSTIGFSVFLYGRKQARVPQLVAGGLLMACPYVAPSPAWMAAAGVALIAGLWGAVRAGW